MILFAFYFDVCYLSCMASPRQHQPNAKVTFHWDAEIGKFRINVRSLEAETTSFQVLHLDSNMLQAGQYLRMDLQGALRGLIGLRKQLEDLRATGELSTNFEMGRRFPAWIDEVDDMIRRIKMCLDLVDRKLAGAQQQAPSALTPTKGSKGLYGNHSMVADVLTGLVIAGAGYAVYKSVKK